MGNNVVLAESAAAVYEEPDTVIEQVCVDCSRDVLCDGFRLKEGCRRICSLPVRSGW